MINTYGFDPQQVQTALYICMLRDPDYDAMPLEVELIKKDDGIVFFKTKVNGKETQIATDIGHEKIHKEMLEHNENISAALVRNKTDYYFVLSYCEKNDNEKNEALLEKVMEDYMRVKNITSKESVHEAVIQAKTIMVNAR